MEEKNKTIWLPRAIGELEGPIYLMSATHRGDMYHLRAAMAFEKRPIVLYDCSPSTAQLEDYLDLSQFGPKIPTFRTPWTREQLSSQQKPKALPEGTKFNGEPFADVSKLMSMNMRVITEGDATSGIVSHLQVPEDLRTLRDQMVLQVVKNDKIPENDKKKLRENLVKLLQSMFGERNSKTVVVMHRDSGAQPSGAYPELDSGSGKGSALDTIANRVGGFPSESGASFIPVYCGDVAPTEMVPSLGKYWEKLTPYRLQGMSARDLEAYFWQVAAEERYFCAAVGFRSGALDLFTFLGIPTVSISLRNMVGESRHAKLAMDKLKRVNVNYEQPRHDATAWFQDRNNRDSILLGSPYWVYNESNGPPLGVKQRAAPSTQVDERKLRSQPVRNFANFDTQTVRTGIWVGLSRFVIQDSGQAPAIQFLDPTIIKPSIVSNITEAFAYNAGKIAKYGSVTAYVQNQQTLSDADMTTRGKQLALLQEPDAIYKASADSQAQAFKSALGFAKNVR